MRIFESEKDLVATLDEHDAIVSDLVSDRLSFSDFLEKYNDFYAYFALDGHESDNEERQLLDKYEKRISLHHRILMESLSGLADDEDAKKQIYIHAGRYGSAEAIRRIKQLARNTTRV